MYILRIFNNYSSAFAAGGSLLVDRTSDPPPLCLFLNCLSHAYLLHSMYKWVCLYISRACELRNVARMPGISALDTVVHFIRHRDLLLACRHSSCRPSIGFSAGVKSCISL